MTMTIVANMKMMMMIKRRSVEIASLSSRRKQEGASSLEGGGEVGRAARDSGNLQPVLLLASLDKSILQIRWGRMKNDQ